MKHCRAVYRKKLILIFGSKYIYSGRHAPKLWNQLKTGLFVINRKWRKRWYDFMTLPSSMFCKMPSVCKSTRKSNWCFMKIFRTNTSRVESLQGWGQGLHPQKKWWVVWKPRMSCTQDALLYLNCCLKCQLWATTSHIGAYVVLVSCLNQMNKYNKVKWNNLPSVTSKVSRNSSSSLTSASASCGSFQNLIWRGELNTK